MDERRMQFLVGVMVFFTVIIIIFLAVLLGGLGSFIPHPPNISFVFSEAPGVIEGTPVKKSGILIGRVTKVELVAAGGALVRAHIDEEKLNLIYQNEEARIHASLVGGDAVIDIVTDPKRKGEPRVPVAEGAELTGETEVDPIQVVANLEKGLSQGIESVSKTSNDVGNAVRRLDDLIQVNREKIDRITTQTDEATAALQKLVADPNMKETIDLAPKLLREMRETNDQMKKLVPNVERTFKNLEEFTDVLGKRGPDIIDQLDQSAHKFQRAVTEMAQVSGKLNDNKGSLGLLINDPELYQRINNAAGNVEDLTRELKPVIRDARFLTDELARHPEKLGVRGALERSPGTKWP